MKYNVFCVISDGVNNKAGTVFSPYEFFYGWNKITGDEKKALTGIETTTSIVHGMLNQKRLVDIIHHFVLFPDTSKHELKILARYPQYYAANKLYQNILVHRKPEGDGKGGTYFGATGCGKSYTMLYLSRLLMRSTDFASPTIIIISDRTDLDDQLSKDFTNAKKFIGDENIINIESRADLRDRLRGIESGGVYLTTVQKFAEDAEILSDRTNIICISDEAHRSQVNLDLKVKIDEEKGVTKSYGFAKYLHDSLPNATYVGFTGTPIDKTLEVFGDVVDQYTMFESVNDEITVRLVYEGRAAKVNLDYNKVQEIENYYENAVAEGASEYHVEASQKAIAKMEVVLGDSDRIKAIAKDFIEHYEGRLQENATVAGKVMFVCASRGIAYKLYQEIINTLGARSSRFEQNININNKNSSFEQNININNKNSSFEQNINDENTDFDYSKSIDATNYAQYFTKSFGFPEEWHTRNLPHRNKRELVQFITYRLADSLPQNVLKKIEQEIEHLTDKEKDVEKRKKHEYWLDKGIGSCALSNPTMAQKVLEAFQYHDGIKYDLLAWSIMPNHVHLLIRTKDDLPKIIQSLKSYTGKWALQHNKQYNLGLDKGATQFWMPEYWDRFIRDEAHFNATVRYILNNPAKAKLPKNDIAYMFTGIREDLGPGGNRMKQELEGNRMKQELHSTRELHPSQIKMVMTRNKDDEKELWDLLGTKEDRKELERQFKDIESNFKIAIVVDMWLTGFDVPFLDTIYIDKPLQTHNLIQTISRVNRKYEGKDRGLVVDYIGIKKNLNKALGMFNNQTADDDFEDIAQAEIIVRDQLDLLRQFFHQFDSSSYFKGLPIERLQCLNKASELVLKTEESEKLFVNITKKLKSAYNLVSGSELFTYKEVEEIHFYFAVSSIVRKLTKGEAPDTAQMNAKVAKLVEEAIISEGVEEIFKLDDNKANTIDLFNDKFIEKISNLELPNTKIKILERLLKQTINDFKKVNKVKGQDFSERLQSIINRYNERSEGDILDYEGIQFDTAEQMIELIIKLRAEMDSFQDLGIDYEEKAFYDILDMICKQYGFEFDNDKMLELAREIKKIVDNTAKYPDWNDRDDIKAQLKMDIIVKLHEFGYPPITQEDVYKNVLEQAENFKKNR